MKKLTIISIILFLIIFFASCTDENLITDNSSVDLRKPTLEKVIQESVMGHGAVHYTNYSGVKCYQRFSFTATCKDGITHGILEYFDDEHNLRFKGEINCININENQAVLGGEIINYQWDIDYELSDEQMYFWVKVIDNGEGINASPDETSLVFAPIGDYGCIDFDAPLYEIENGNFQVKQYLD